MFHLFWFGSNIILILVLNLVVYFMPNFNSAAPPPIVIHSVSTIIGLSGIFAFILFSCSVRKVFHANLDKNEKDERKKHMKLGAADAEETAMRKALLKSKLDTRIDERSKANEAVGTSMKRATKAP